MPLSLCSPVNATLKPIRVTRPQPPCCLLTQPAVWCQKIHGFVVKHISVVSPYTQEMGGAVSPSSLHPGAGIPWCPTLWQHLLGGNFLKFINKWPASREREKNILSALKWVRDPVSGTSPCQMINSKEQQHQQLQKHESFQRLKYMSRILLFQLNTGIFQYRSGNLHFSASSFYFLISSQSRSKSSFIYLTLCFQIPRSTPEHRQGLTLAFCAPGGS